MVWETGFEPAVSRAQAVRFTRLSYSQIMVLVEGIAPTRISKDTSFTDLLAYFNELHQHMAPEVGLEPTSRSGGLTVLCVYQFRHSGINY